MKVAILSDIHGNLEGLRKVLKIISRNKVDKIICLGDVVGYGTDSKQCYEILKNKNCDFMMGNHDAMYCNIINSDSCSSNGKISTMWQKKYIKIDLNDIKKFKKYIRIDNLLFVHSCLGEYGYLKYFK